MLEKIAAAASSPISTESSSPISVLEEIAAAASSPISTESSPISVLEEEMSPTVCTQPSSLSMEKDEEATVCDTTRASSSTVCEEWDDL